MEQQTTNPTHCNEQGWHSQRSTCESLSNKVHHTNTEDNNHKKVRLKHAADVNDPKMDVLPNKVIWPYVHI